MTTFRSRRDGSLPEHEARRLIRLLGQRDDRIRELQAQVDRRNKRLRRVEDENTQLRESLKGLLDAALRPEIRA